VSIGNVFLVGAGPGDSEPLTLQAMRAINEAEQRFGKQSPRTIFSAGSLRSISWPMERGRSVLLLVRHAAGLQWLECRAHVRPPHSASRAIISGRASIPLRRLAVALVAFMTVSTDTACPAESPAFQGHAAEMQQRNDAEERRRRALYFDSVDVEIGPQGLSCDHIAATKPDAIAGPGFVVLATIDGIRAITGRVWLPPGVAPAATDATRMAETEFASRFPGMTVQITDIHRFIWCR
jgi:hypothetical protein